MEHWYALHTRPHAEKAVAAALAQRGLSAYLPTVPATQRHQGRPMSELLFPSYLFCRCDLDITPFSALRWTPGLRRMVTFGDTPAIVPDAAIQLIQQRALTIEARGGLPNHPFHVGDTVQLKSGPMSGLLAVFDGPMGPSERVYILLDFLGQQNRVAVAPAMLELTQRPPRRTRGHGRPIRA